jgi:hypothetical protein
MGREPGRGWRIYLVSYEGGSNAEELVAGEDSQAAPDCRDGNSVVFAGFPACTTGPGATHRLATPRVIRPVAASLKKHTSICSARRGAQAEHSRVAPASTTFSHRYRRKVYVGRGLPHYCPHLGAVSTKEAERQRLATSRRPTG